MKLIDDAKLAWRFGSLRAHAALASIGILQFVDPQLIVYLFNAMPRPVREILPESIFRALGFVVMLIAVWGMFSRMTVSKRLQKIREKKAKSDVAV